ncbi:MAG TPA: formate dehydrogenase accessory sulfurtransferase FdhD [Xanthomonadaceae bacterium]|jgi:formate dehydrogenase accessory protein FdhD|nr:formate dehydrogenase accessory sulfurtransferase FdhD [Xanthomonadaceae bacterium]
MSESPAHVVSKPEEIVGLKPAPSLRIEGSRREDFDDVVIEEVAIALLYNGRSYAVMMATPTDLPDFALGFALTEGIVASPDEFKLVDCVRGEHGIALHAAIPQARFDALDSRERNLAGRSGCGLCGTESLEAAIRPVRKVVSDARLSSSAIAEALRQLPARQELNRRCGGAHAAGYVHAGDIIVREDVGRHNALDKLAGALARSAFATSSGATSAHPEGFLVITSRASYEIVHKSAAIGIAIIAAMSAPTDLAIRIAHEAGITLIAFARGEAMTVYTNPQRLR